MKQNKTMKIIIISIIVIILIAAGVFAYLYFATDMFKPAEQLFYKYMAKNSKLLELADYSELQNLQEKQKTASHTNTGDVSIEVSGDSEEAKELVKVLNNFKINFSGRTDAVNNKSYEEINLLYKTVNLLKVKYLQNADKYVLASDEIVSKYIGVENNNLKEFAKRLGMSDTELESFPNKIEGIDYSKLFDISEQDIAKIQNKYMTIITNNIPKENYLKGSEVLIQKNNTSISAVPYSLTLTGTQVKTVVVELLKALKEDDETLNLFASKMVNIVDNNKITNVNNLKQNIEQAISKIENNTVNNNSESLKIIVYVSNKEVVRTSIQIVNEVEFLIDVKDNAATVSINMLQENSELGYTSMTCDFSKIKSQGKTIINVTGKLYNKENVLTDVSMDITVNEQDTTNNQEMVLNISTGDINATITINNKIEFTNAIESIEDITNNNSVILNNYSQEQIAILFNAIGNQISKTFMEKLQLVMLNQ